MPTGVFEGVAGKGQRRIRLGGAAAEGEKPVRALSARYRKAVSHRRPHPRYPAPDDGKNSGAHRNKQRNPRRPDQPPVFRKSIQIDFIISRN